jgi:integrase
MLGTDYEELIKVSDGDKRSGEVLLFVRNGIFQARIYKGDRKYLYRSLKTNELAVARQKAEALWHKIGNLIEMGMPITQVSMSQLIDEYVKLRENDYKLSLTAKQNISNEQHTSKQMLRQIQRVVKFWREYCGNMSVDRVDDAVLREYITWRKEYYHRMPAEKRPKNAKLNPTDKTLQWELILGKMLVKYAHEKGYRGKMQLPTYSFTAKKKIVRPAFTRSDFKTLLQALRDLVKETTSEKYYYARRLLQTYVLILSDTGMRVGEANKLKWGDLTPIVDGRGRKNYEIKVRGKTGVRSVVGRTNVYGYFERMRKLNETNEPSDYIFRMKGGSRIITLIDQFQRVLESAKIAMNGDGERYTLYSLRHFYAVRFLRKGIPVWDIARNMGTSVKMIQDYYGKQATPTESATVLGG